MKPITLSQYEKALEIVKKYRTQEKDKDIFKLLEKGFYDDVIEYIIKHCDFEIDNTYFTVDPAYGLEALIDTPDNSPVAVGALDFLKEIKRIGRISYEDYLWFK